MIGVQVQVDDSQLQVRLKGANERINQRLRDVINTLAFDMQSHIRRDKLSGNPVGIVTGDLRRSINVKFQNDGMTALVGASTPYAGRIEYGFQGNEQVTGYYRRSIAQMKSAKYNALGVETRPSKSKAKGTGGVYVRPHSRQANTPERSYLRSSLRDMRERIISEMQAAVVGGAL